MMSGSWEDDEYEIEYDETSAANRPLGDEEAVRKGRKEVRAIGVLDVVIAGGLLIFFAIRFYLQSGQIDVLSSLVSEYINRNFTPFCWLEVFIVHLLQFSFGIFLYNGTWHVSYDCANRACRIWYGCSRFVLDTHLALECVFFLYLIIGVGINPLWFFFGLFRLLFRIVAEIIVKSYQLNMAGLQLSAGRGPMQQLPNSYELNYI